jgi:hypothetical protein
MPFSEKIQEWRDRPFRVGLYPFGVAGRGTGSGTFGASNRTKLPAMNIFNIPDAVGRENGPPGQAPRRRRGRPDPEYGA